MAIEPPLSALGGMDAAWRDAYIKALPAAVRFVAKLPIVRVVVPHRGARKQVEIDDVLRDGKLKKGHKSLVALDGERRLGAADGVYFHGGRTHPVYGKVALVFHPLVEEVPLNEEDRKKAVEVTPFGLGGLLCDKPEGQAHPEPPECVLPVSHLEVSEQAAFVQASTWPCPWRDKAGQWLAAYFGPNLDAYFAAEDAGRPTRLDPAGVYHPTTGSRDWRAWTFEVRIIAEEIDLHGALDSGRVMMWAMEDELFTHMIQQTPKPGAEPSWFSRLMTMRVPRISVPEPDARFEDVLRAVDEEVKRACLA